MTQKSDQTFKKINCKICREDFLRDWSDKNESKLNS